MPSELGKSKTALRVADVAKILSVSERQIYKLVQSGEIPYFRVGNAVRFDPLIISRWVGEREDEHPGAKANGRKRV
jgi:excisionase family DNA binding protein